MKDTRLEKIKSAVFSVLPESEIILFGSRARRNFADYSDYDILVILPYEIDMRKKMKLSTKIRKMLLEDDISVDIILQSESEVEVKKNFIGTVVREAVKEGIKI